jgi:hypothetical protein
MIRILFIFFTISASNLYGQKNGIIALDKKITLHWEIQKFEKSKHTYEYCLKSNLKYLCKIDNQEWFGSDFGREFPKNKLSKLELNINNKKISLETSKMYNPNYHGLLSESQFKLKKEKEYYILYAFFSDGAGSYSAHWKIENGKSKRIVLSNDEKYFEWQLE